MNRNQAIRRHRMLWRWLAKTGSSYKAEWPGWKFNGGRYSDNTMARCFLCDFTKGTEIQCNSCPLEWPGERGNCNPLFNDWDLNASIEERRKLAKQIAELPVRKLKKEE